MDNVGDPTALPDLLDQIDGTVAMFIADCDYDESPTRNLLERRLGEIVEVVIPPPKLAVQSPKSAKAPLVRDPDESMKDCDWDKSQGEDLRQSDHRSKDPRPCAQPGDRTRSHKIQARGLKYPKGRVISSRI
jgi:hypothetical protein